MTVGHVDTAGLGAARAVDGREPLIDCNVFVGRSNGAWPTGGKHHTGRSLLAEMDRVGVTDAIAYHIVSREHAPAVGNTLLTDEIAGHPRLHPCWVVLPSHTGELPAPPELVPQLRSAGIRLVRMFPASSFAGHRYALREWCTGPLLTALEHAGVVVALDFGLFRRSEPPWDDIVEICTHHPTLPVILMDIQGRNNRSLYPLLELFAGLHVQTAGFNVHRGLEDLCARFGPERLIFGSGFPLCSMGAARFHLDRAQIAPADKALIAAGNLRRLLGLTRDPTEPDDLIHTSRRRDER